MVLKWNVEWTILCLCVCVCMVRCDTLPIVESRLQIWRTLADSNERVGGIECPVRHSNLVESVEHWPYRTRSNWKLCMMSPNMCVCVCVFACEQDESSMKRRSNSSTRYRIVRENNRNCLNVWMVQPLESSTVPICWPFTTDRVCCVTNQSTRQSRTHI